LGEVACAFRRNLREGSLNDRQYQALLGAFMQHADSGIWTFVPVTERLLRKMTVFIKTLPAAVALRAGDAVHLTTAMDLGENEIWSSDRHVVAAAPYFGLTGRTV
jgi:hypothetical protein